MANLICTFNANNLYARYRLGQIFPGDQRKKALPQDLLARGEAFA